MSEAESSAPVCDEVARFPAGDRPPLTARIGLERLTRRAMGANLRGLPNDSRYSIIRSVAPSASQYWMTSLPDRSALLPTDTNDEIPDPSACARAITAMPSPPLWERKPTRPGVGLSGAKVASRLTPPAVLMTPMQFG